VNINLPDVGFGVRLIYPISMFIFELISFTSVHFSVFFPIDTVW